MRFCSFLRVQLKCNVVPTSVPFWPGRHLPTLGLEASRPYLYSNTAQHHHNLATQTSAVPLLCQTNVWGPADLHAACTCPKAASRGGEWGLKTSSNSLPAGRKLFSYKGSAFSYRAPALVEPAQGSIVFCRAYVTDEFLAVPLCSDGCDSIAIILQHDLSFFPVSHK